MQKDFVLQLYLHATIFCGFLALHNHTKLASNLLVVLFSSVFLFPILFLGLLLNDPKPSSLPYWSLLLLMLFYNILIVLLFFGNYVRVTYKNILEFGLIEVFTDKFKRAFSNCKKLLIRNNESVTVRHSHLESLENITAQFIRLIESFHLRSTAAIFYVPIIYLIFGDLYPIIFNSKYLLVSAITLGNLLIMWLCYNYKLSRLFVQIRDQVNHLNFDGKFVVILNDLTYDFISENQEVRFKNDCNNYFIIRNESVIMYFFHPKIDYSHFKKLAFKIGRYHSLKSVLEICYR